MAYGSIAQTCGFYYLRRSPKDHGKVMQRRRFMRCKKLSLREKNVRKYIKGIPLFLNLIQAIFKVRFVSKSDIRLSVHNIFRTFRIFRS